MVSMLGAERRHAGARRVIAVLAMAGLASCSSVPERRVAPAKPPTSAPRATAAASAARPVPIMRAAGGVDPAGDARSASSPSASPAQAVSAAVAAPAVPEPAAVAARFPDPPVSFDTPAFQPGHRGVTTHAELHEAMQSLARDVRVGGPTVKLLNLGSSQAGTPIEALLFTRLPNADPVAVATGTRPTVLLVAQQHGDEPAGAEAWLVAAQRLAHGPWQPLLERLNVIVLPCANPDGAQDGRRDTASGIDLNRDHLLLMTPEAQAQARLMREYRPAVVVDAHEYPSGPAFVQKFGALPRYDALLQYAMTANLPEFIGKAAEEWFRQPMAASLKAQGLSSEWYHASSNDPADKKIAMGGVDPDNARNAHGLMNAVSLLVETRGAAGGQHLKRRVFTQLVAAESVLRSTAERADDLMKLRRYVDSEVSAKACQGDITVAAAPTPSEYTLVMLDPQTGADKPVTVAWDSALALHPLKTRARPCGYWLAASETDAVTRLRALGVVVQQLDELGEMRAELYTESARELAARDDARSAVGEGGGLLRLQVGTVPALLDAPEGSYYVGLDQPLANLVIAALEPDTPFSYAGHRVVSGPSMLARVMGVPNVKMSPLP